MAKWLRYVSLPVTDQDRARDFYVNQLGFELRNDSPAPQGRWVEVAPPGAQTALTLVTWFPGMQPGALQGLVLESDDVRSEYELLKSRGVAFKGPLQTQSWGTYAEFEDPDGNGWVLQQP
jgi:catechol 2,3-dioxygenase-like lactoylglutathione lyase family enzyme